MACKKDELLIFKAASAKLDDNTVFILAYVLHTEKMEDPVTRLTKNNTAKSKYLYLGRVATVKQIQDKIVDGLQDANRLKDWTWPDMQSFDILSDFKYISYDGDSSRARESRWLSSKLKKALPWDDFLKVLDGFKPAKKAYSTSARYPTDNYVASDGSTIAELKEAKDILLKSVGKTFIHECPLKNKH